MNFINLYKYITFEPINMGGHKTQVYFNAKGFFGPS